MTVSATCMLHHAVRFTMQQSRMGCDIMSNIYLYQRILWKIHDVHLQRALMAPASVLMADLLSKQVELQAEICKRQPQSHSQWRRQMKYTFANLQMQNSPELMQLE